MTMICNGHYTAELCEKCKVKTKCIIYYMVILDKKLEGFDKDARK